MAIDHEFGGHHTDLKLSIVENYLKAYTTALKPYFEQLWYIDAFAGTGSRTVRVEALEGDLFDAAVPERVEQRRGSAQIAIEIVPRFDRLIFIESKPAHYGALLELAAQHSDRAIVVVKDDANRAIQQEITWSGWKYTRAVMFLDPYGMNVEWPTLQAVADTKAIDVWFLFSLSGLYRQATRRISDIDVNKRAAMTRILGTTEWEQELYADPVQSEMFGGEEKQRTADVRGLERYVKRRLETIFAKVFDPLPLPVREKPQRFSLFCASRTRSQKLSGSRRALLITSSRWEVHRRSRRGMSGRRLSCSCRPTA